jgi:uncharacterized protein
VTRWLLDTGPLVAFFDRSDSYHQWAVEPWATAPVPFLTCEAVIAEATYLLAEHAFLPPNRVLALVERGVVSVPFRIEERVGSLARILEKYRDQGMRLADACLVSMSEGDPRLPRLHHPPGGFQGLQAARAPGHAPGGAAGARVAATSPVIVPIAKASLAYLPPTISCPWSEITQPSNPTSTRARIAWAMSM